MANVGTVRTGAELFMDSLLENTAPSILRYYAKAEFDGTPAAAEIFLNGEENARFYLPINSAVYGRLVFMAWNMTDGDQQQIIVTQEVAAARDSGDVVAVEPTNLSGTDGNPISVRSTVPGSETVAMAADDTNKALVLNFTGEASKNYIVSATFAYTFVGAKMRSSNYILATG